MCVSIIAGCNQPGKEVKIVVGDPDVPPTEEQPEDEK
jgi:hypothetical protein